MEGKQIATMTNGTKAFGKRTILDQVSLTIKQGTILGLIGPSGSGKTTLIKTLLGMEKLDEGKAVVFDQATPNRSILKQIGYMGQEDALYAELSGTENLQFFGQMMGMEKKEIQQRMAKVLSLVKLEATGKQQVQTYSGGMKRRLSLAITLLAAPELLILDEPTVGIDPSLRLVIWEQLKKLASEGNSILLTTHVMDEAERCDEVALIIDGKIFASGTPNGLKKQFQAETIEEVFLKAERRQS